MKAVHFGAGNIGRGFIGALLDKSDYHTTFVDVNKQVIDAINDKKQYNVILADENKDELIVKNISGINSIENPDQVTQSIADADIITTAVGPNILPIIAGAIAKGLRLRTETKENTPLTIIACENMIGGSQLLKEKVYELISADEKEQFERLFSFPNAAVDRIVPNQTNPDPLTVSVEPYYEWVVEGKDIIGEKPPVEGIHYVDDLTPYIERKLFTVNTGHAVAAYLGHYLGYATIKEAMDTEQIQQIVKGALHESGEVLIKKYNFDRSEHQNYIGKIMNRFMNPHISDEVTRVGRGPIRKLGKNDRLIRPATAYIDLINEEPVYLAKTIAAALNYTSEHDEEAVNLQAKVKELGFVKALQEVSELENDHPLFQLVLDQLDEIKKLK